MSGADSIKVKSTVELKLTAGNWMKKQGLNVGTISSVRRNSQSVTPVAFGSSFTPVSTTGANSYKIDLEEQQHNCRTLLDNLIGRSLGGEISASEEARAGVPQSCVKVLPRHSGRKEKNLS